MSVQRCTVALLAILISSAVSTACGNSTPVPPTATPKPAAIQAAPTRTPFLPAPSLAQTAIDPASDDWLIRVCNGEQDVPVEPSPQYAPQARAPEQDKAAGTEEDWLIRVLNGE